MKQYDVTGMSCAACSARVEKAVSKLPGVTSCSVNLLTNSMGVEGDVSEEAVIQAVVDAGYGASPKGSRRTVDKNAVDVSEVSSEADPKAEDFEDKEARQLKRRLIASIGFLLILMYFSMGHTMWGWPVPSFMAENPLGLGVLQLILTIVVMVINRKFFISGGRSLFHGSPNMDTLVALGAGAAFVYSSYALFAMMVATKAGDMHLAHQYMHEFYFESAAMILTLITVGKMLEARAKGKTTDALKRLMQMAPKRATVVRDGKEFVVPIEEVSIGDEFVVRPGENIPVDGIVIEGSGAVNEAALTGESLPVDKASGDIVSAATANTSGFLRCKATRVGEDTTLSQIIQMVSDAAATKAPIAKIADKVSGIFVPVVIAIAIVTFVIWMLVEKDMGFAIARGISVLVISCPCALGLATPVAIMVGSGLGAKHGVLFKTAVSLEEAGRAQIVALDKTGTITSGRPVVTDIVSVEGISEEELLAYAYALESKSEHPLAHAIVEKAKGAGIEAPQVTDFTILPGNGLEATLEGQCLFGGNKAYFQKKIGHIDDAFNTLAETVAAEGKTPLFFGYGQKVLGIIAVADTIKEDSPSAIRELQNMGIRVVMLTGDNEITAQAIGKQAGVDEVIAGVLPEGKEAVIRQLKEQGKVAMVGDGINDAPALTRADIGIAIGAGTDVAIDAADIVLMKSRLTDVVAAIRLSRATLRNIRQNLFWAFFYNVIGIPLAAGLWIPIFGWELNPMFGAAAMSLSSFCVVTNALRLNLFPIYEPGRDKTIQNTLKQECVMKQKSQMNTCEIIDRNEERAMEKTINIEGMMCPHCSGRVQKVLEEMPEVTSAVVSHETGSAVVTLACEVSDEKLAKTVTDAGYKVTGIQ